MKLVCGECGKEFVRSISPSAYKRNKLGFFCSSQCTFAWRRSHEKFDEQTDGLIGCLAKRINDERPYVDLESLPWYNGRPEHKIGERR